MISLDRSSQQPLFQQVKAGLLEQLGAGAFPSGTPLPSERELAAQLGLSSLTVRRAIVELSQEGLLRRIPGRGTFVTAGAVRSAPGRFSLILPTDRSYDLTGRFSMHLLRGLHEAVRPAALVLRNADGEPEDPRRSQGGVALWVSDPAALRRLAARGAPLVGYECASETDAAPPCDHVAHANASGAQAATAALIGLGHRDLACAWQDSSSGRERLAGFRLAMAQHDLPVPPTRTPVCDNRGEAGYFLGRRLLAGADAPTALVCSDDGIAYGVLAAAQELGREVPGFLSLVGFGDLGVFTTPALSSVRMDIAGSARAVVDLLRQRAARPAAPPRQLVLPTEYIRRASCGPPRPA